jgi:hypothetical protein
LWRMVWSSFPQEIGILFSFLVSLRITSGRSPNSTDRSIFLAWPPGCPSLRMADGFSAHILSRQRYRVVHIDPVLSDLLREHLNGRRGGRVFQTRTGTPLSKGNVRRKLHETLRALGIPLGGLHAFRHGRVSVLQSRGVPGDLVKEWVGHSNLHTTSPYTNVDDGYKRRVARSVGLRMEGKLPDGPHGPHFQAQQEV